TNVTKCDIIGAVNAPVPEPILLFTVKLRRTKPIITCLAVVYVVLATATWLSASHRITHTGDFSYQTRLKHDLDGDHIPETATIQERGQVYQVSILHDGPAETSSNDLSE